MSQKHSTHKIFGYSPFVSFWSLKNAAELADEPTVQQTW